MMSLEEFASIRAKITGINHEIWEINNGRLVLGTNDENEAAFKKEVIAELEAKIQQLEEKIKEYT